MPITRTPQRHGNSIRQPSVRLLWEEERGEERLPPFLPRQTCGVAAELSRGHTTHVSAPSLPHSPPLTCQFLSRLPLANTVINLSVCLPRCQNQWTVLGAGVDTAAAHKAGATCLEYTVTSANPANLRGAFCASVNLVTICVREKPREERLRYLR